MRLPSPALLLLIALATCLGCNKPASQHPEPDPAHRGGFVTMSIDAKGIIPADTQQFPVQPGMKLADIVHDAADMQFVLKDYGDMGHLVVGLGGLMNDKEPGHYWQFCLDGTFSDRGIDEVELGPGQWVSWYYRAYGEGPCKKIGE